MFQPGQGLPRTALCVPQCLEPLLVLLCAFRFLFSFLFVCTCFLCFSVSLAFRVNILLFADNSAFHNLLSSPLGGFRLYSQFAVFVYSQLQSILSDEVLGSVTDWDKFLNLDMDDTNLKFKGRAEFLQNKDFSTLVSQSRVPTPSKFVDQCITFYQSFCRILLNHDVLRSDLVRGLSCFDPAVLLDSPEKHYRDCIERLVSYFAECGWLPTTSKDLVVSQYRSFVSKIRKEKVNPDDWLEFLSGSYEMRNRSELHNVFKYACLCICYNDTLQNPFEVSVPGYHGDLAELKSCVRCLQSAFQLIPNVSSIFLLPERVPKVFPLLKRNPSILSDRKFSFWGMSKSCLARRSSLFVQLDACYCRATSREEIALSQAEEAGTSTTVCYGAKASSSSANETESPNFSKAVLAVPRCSEDPGFLGNVPSAAPKLAKKLKKTPQKKL